MARTSLTSCDKTVLVLLDGARFSFELDHSSNSIHGRVPTLVEYVYPLRAHRLQMLVGVLAPVAVYDFGRFDIFGVYRRISARIAVPQSGGPGCRF
jgi:hypothetical protein